ncbi:trihelix transcription factor ENAP1-like isoform X2 [Nymphaea colorata]|uniref:trihelix transcription factor ENAP1-like isoform X2 n=1 Tax=Nymphaea colorata TaxID=210225 RepID=UPI00129D7FC3|nr:trihelix transcription factor ENAP1-like isoform X2 [Nymphaea colorata]
MEERETAGGTSGGSRPVSGREDCWSEGATVALIQAWGDRHLELNRGNLKQKHWQEVADAVNAMPGAARARKTDVQCKNRIDTLKKKYKAEKARVLATNGAFVSKWPYYDRIDDLIGPAATTKKALPVTPAVKGEPPMALPLYRTTAVPVVAARAAAAAAGKEKRPAEDDYVFRRIPTSDTQSGSSRSKTSPDSAESSRESKGKGGNGDGDGGGFRELARAIMRFGEIYEKVEAAKQRQMMDLERQRMEFVKGLEFQRMQIFMDSQVELAKMKKAKRANTVLPEGRHTCVEAARHGCKNRKQLRHGKMIVESYL